MSALTEKINFIKRNCKICSDCKTCDIFKKIGETAPDELKNLRPFRTNSSTGFSGLDIVNGYNCLFRRTYASTHESHPIDGDHIVIHEVLGDLRERAEFGKRKYGTFLKTNNGRNALVDAYQEALDLVMYLKQKIMEQGIDKAKPQIGDIVDCNTNLFRFKVQKMLRDEEGEWVGAEIKHSDDCLGVDKGETFWVKIGNVTKVKNESEK